MLWLRLRRGRPRRNVRSQRFVLGSQPGDFLPQPICLRRRGRLLRLMPLLLHRKLGLRFLQQQLALRALLDGSLQRVPRGLQLGRPLGQKGLQIPRRVACLLQQTETRRGRSND